MAWRDNVIRPLGGIDCHRHGARAVCGADPGGHAFARLDGDGECSLMPREVLAAHQVEAEGLHPLLGEREADQAASVGSHEIDCIWRCHLRGDDEVALVLAVFVIDQDEHAAVAGLVDDFLDRHQYRRLVVVGEIAVELAEGFGGRVPAVLGAVAQGVSMEASGPGESGAADLAIGDDAAHAFDDDVAHDGHLSHYNVNSRGVYHIPSLQNRRLCLTHGQSMDCIEEAA